MTFCIKTFGCQMNVADSQRLESYYLARGYKKAKSIDTADRIIINTCAIRQSAEDRVYALVKKLKLNNKKVILTGCMVGMALKDQSGKLLERLKKAAPGIDEYLPIEEVGFEISPIRTNVSHAFIPISNGCNNFCSYCVVPYSRGREVSRPFEEIINEIKDLIKKGTTEITLVGQNVNSYGSDLISKKYKPIYVKHLGRYRISTLFPHLLSEVAKIKKIKKISFISSNPWDFSDELIDVIAKYSKIDRTIHLPVQSGDDEILKKMNRWYTAKEYLDLVKKIKSKIKNVKFTTDIIVGFCGETNQAFQNTVNLCKKVGFVKAYIAEYSVRPGTLAAKNFVDDVSNPTKKQRFRILDKLINKHE
jgi:tRNA-2-methylthio-N6-dimethylallyladenosine synthase